MTLALAVASLAVSAAFLIVGVLRAFDVRFPTCGLVTWRGKPIDTAHPHDGWGGLL